MKEVNLKDNELSAPEDTKQDCNQDGCACSPEFGCKNCEEEDTEK